MSETIQVAIASFDELERPVGELHTSLGQLAEIREEEGDVVIELLKEGAVRGPVVRVAELLQAIQECRQRLEI